jgi:hypothetical protein
MSKPHKRLVNAMGAVQLLVPWLFKQQPVKMTVHIANHDHETRLDRRILGPGVDP